MVFPIGRSASDFGLGATILMRVPSVALLDRDDNQPAAINISEGSTSRLAVTNVFH
jgi:hypothetical protein